MRTGGSPCCWLLCSAVSVAPPYVRRPPTPVPSRSGKALAIVRATKSAGTISIKATASGLLSNPLAVTAQWQPPLAGNDDAKNADEAFWSIRDTMAGNHRGRFQCL